MASQHLLASVVFIWLRKST